MANALANPLLADSAVGANPLMASSVDSPDYGMYGSELNWEDSFGPASKHLGVSEEQWQWFISSINQVKEQMAVWEGNGGNPARVMQNRTTPDMMRDRRVAVLKSQGLTTEEALAQIEADPEYQKFVKDYEFYEAMNSTLNELYAAVGLDAAGTISGGTGTSHGNGYTVDFNFMTGEVSHNKGDLIHDFGKGLIKGIAASAFGAGLASFLGAYMSPTLANAVSKFVVSQVTGGGGDIGVEDALGLAFGGSIPELGEIDDVILTDIKDTVVDYVTDPDNYDDGNRIVWDTHGGTDDIGNPVINIPNYDEFYEEEAGGGGGGGSPDSSPDSNSDSAPETGSDGTPDSGGGDPNDDPLGGGDADWTYRDGVWTNGTDIIYGPGSEGDTMTDEEMADGFENGTHTNADGLEGGGETDEGTEGEDGRDDKTELPTFNPTPDTDSNTNDDSTGDDGTPDTTVDTPTTDTGVDGPDLTPTDPNRDPLDPTPTTDGTDSGGTDSGGTDSGGTPADGEPCTDSQGNAGTMQNGYCVISMNPDGGGTDPGGTGGTGTDAGGTGDGAGDGEGSGDGTGDGSGSGDGTGDGSGSGNGSGDGSGSGDGNGSGNGSGNGGNGMLAGAGGDNGRPSWGQLNQTPKFRRHTPHQSKVTQSLFGDLMGKDWLREIK